jgi:hypothetical protein
MGTKGSWPPGGAREPAGTPAAPNSRGSGEPLGAPGAMGSMGSRGSRGPGRWVSLRGGLGVAIIAAAAMIGAIATVVTDKQPGTLLGAAVLAGTVIAALTIRPRAGRMIFPAPVLCYLIAALAAGVSYDHSVDRAALAIDATQWIASGFFLMALATLLAIVIVTARWLFQRHASRGGPDWTEPRGSGRPEPATRPGVRDADEWSGPGAAATQRMPRPPLPAGPRGTDQPAGPRPDQRPGRPTGPRPTTPRPGARPGPYNFSSGA